MAFFCFFLLNKGVYSSFAGSIYRGFLYYSVFYSVFCPKIIYGKIPGGNMY